jgi:hypothetical protein
MSKVSKVCAALVVSGVLISSGVAYAADPGEYHGPGSGFPPTGTFSMSSKATKPIVRMQSMQQYTVCNSHMSQGNLVLHYEQQDQKTETATVEPGDCIDVEADAIDVENQNAEKAVFGTYHHHK